MLINLMEVKKKRKQDFLYKEIIEQGYDSADFVAFMQSQRKDGNLGLSRRRHR